MFSFHSFSHLILIDKQKWNWYHTNKHTLTKLLTLILHKQMFSEWWKENGKYCWIIVKHVIVHNTKIITFLCKNVCVCVSHFTSSKSNKNVCKSDKRKHCVRCRKDLWNGIYVFMCVKYTRNHKRIWSVKWLLKLQNPFVMTMILCIRVIVICYSIRSKCKHYYISHVGHVNGVWVWSFHLRAFCSYNNTMYIIF
jgi:hypothetical protein